MELSLLEALLPSDSSPTIPDTLLCLPLSSLMMMKVMMKITMKMTMKMTTNEMLMTLMTFHDGKMLERCWKRC